MEQVINETSTRISRSANRILQLAVSGVLRANGTLQRNSLKAGAPFAVLAALTLIASYGTAQTIYSFTSGTDGLDPFAGLAVGKNGELYGTTAAGGTSTACPYSFGCGTVFEMTPPAPGHAWTESVIYRFPQYSYPLAAVTVGPSGELYGTTYYGGDFGTGSVYELAPPSSPGGAWTETTLYSFSYNYGDPQNPEAGVVIGSNGVLYGTVEYSGTSQNCPYSFGSFYGCGGVFSLTPPTSPGGAWTEQTIYIFQGGNADGGVPLAGMALGQNGELYGTTYYGGPSSTCTFFGQGAGCGIVFELFPPASPGGAWTEAVLYSFMGEGDGGFPSALLYQGGSLYGTVTFGGNLKTCGGVGCGGVFQLSPPASMGDSWTEAVIYGFTGAPDGLYPSAGVAVGWNGELYGTALNGGDSRSCPQDSGCGAVFELTPPRGRQGAWQETVLHSFNVTDGFRPYAGPVIGSDGNLYGTTALGGTSTTCVGGCGTVFTVQLNNQWK